MKPSTVLFEGNVYRRNRIKRVRRFGRTIYVEVSVGLESAASYETEERAEQGRRYFMRILGLKPERRK
jgi:hypothetical protein